MSLASVLRLLAEQFHDKLAEWLTAFATMSMAIFAYLENQRRRRARLPAVEMTVRGDPNLQFALWIRVRNRATEGAFITGAGVLRPAGCHLALYPYEMNGALLPGAFASSQVDLSVELQPAGRPEADAELLISVRPPSGWSGGKLLAEFSFETRGSTIRSQRLLVSRTIQQT